MVHEGSSTHPVAESVKEAIFFDDGTLNEAILMDRYGIGIEEAMQEVVFGNYRGSFAQALASEGCPLDTILSTAYAENGIEGVQDKVRGLSELDPRFQLEISPATTLKEQLKKK